MINVERLVILILMHEHSGFVFVSLKQDTKILCPFGTEIILDPSIFDVFYSKLTQ